VISNERANLFRFLQDERTDSLAQASTFGKGALEEYREPNQRNERRCKMNARTMLTS
jgi:hypothetical protein